MTRTIAVFLISIGSWASPLRAELSSVTGRLRPAAEQERALAEKAKQQERELQSRQEIELRQFEDRFNGLVFALAGFAKEYNQGKGMVWPHREADKLRKAIRQFQSFEKSMRDDPTTAIR